MRISRLAFLSAFTHRNFRLLWTGAFISSIGTWMQDVALSWLIHTRIGDPLVLGLRSFAAEAPLIAFMVVGGALADRVSRKGVLLASNLFQMTMAIILGLLYVFGGLGIGPILVIAFLTGLAQSQSAPTYQAVLTSVVPPVHIANAVALNSLQFNLSRAIGPVLAGVLLVRLGAGACFLANALSFVAVVVALYRIDLAGPTAPPREGLGRSLRVGFDYVRHDKIIGPLTVLAAVASTLSFPLITYLPVFAGDVLHSGAEGYSLLLTGFGVGAIAGALTTAARGNAAGRGRVMLLGFAGFAISTLLAMASRQELVAVCLLVGAGFGTVTAFSTLSSLVQEQTPNEIKGRVLSIFGLAFRGGMPLGSLLAGLFVRRFGVGPTIGVQAMTLLILVAVVWVWTGRGEALTAVHPEA